MNHQFAFAPFEDLESFLDEAEVKHLTCQEMADAIWAKTVEDSLPHKTMAFFLFQQTLNISDEATFDLIDSLVKAVKVKTGLADVFAVTTLRVGLEDTNNLNYGL